MHPDLYFVVHQQRERELEQRLRRRFLQTCCAMLTAVPRPRLATLRVRLASLRSTRRAVECCPA